jgi:hypothetical protein
MRRPTLRLVATIVALSPVSLVLSHNLAFLATYGAGSEAALRATGHDEGWTSAVRAVIAIFFLLGSVGLVRLLGLWRTARRVERESGMQPRTDWQSFGRAVFVIWAWLGVVTAAWFLLQENVERIAIGQPVPGLQPLLEDGPTGPLAIIAVISLVLAFIGGLFGWGIAALRARIAAAIAPRGRHRPARVGRPQIAEPHRSNVLSRNLGLRAPPSPLTA